MAGPRLEMNGRKIPRGKGSSSSFHLGRRLNRIAHFRTLLAFLLVYLVTECAFLSKFPTTTRRLVVFDIVKVLDVFFIRGLGF
jgi:hypothetical protein